MILPIRTSIRPWRTPYANYALIILNALIFAMQFDLDQGGVRPWVEHFLLHPNSPRLWQFISYAFLHQNLMHIFFNMFFLYLFGNNVNDKLGTVGYVSFYLAGAVFSGIGHVLLNQAAVLGASGAVAAVTGAYLVLFPQSLITVIYWLFFLGTLEVPALYFIAFKLILLDNVIAQTTTNVAYDAHIAGYTFGIVALLGLLATGLISSGGFDLWAMIKQWNRRRKYNDAVSSGYDPFGKTPPKKVRAKEVISGHTKKKMEKIEPLRLELNQFLSNRNLSAAADKYVELLEVDKHQVLSQQVLLDIANEFVSKQRYPEAAEAYEKFLAHYSKYEYIEQVELMLGLIYTRYLDQPKKARKHLTIAAEKLKDPAQLAMCKDELKKLT